MERQPAKRSVTIRLALAGYGRIADRAEREDVDFSHMVRRMLAYADRNMPEGWVPSQQQPVPSAGRRS